MQQLLSLHVPRSPGRPPQPRGLFPGSSLPEAQGSTGGPLHGRAPGTAPGIPPETREGDMGGRGFVSCKHGERRNQCPQQPLQCPGLPAPVGQAPEDSLPLALLVSDLQLGALPLPLIRKPSLGRATDRPRAQGECGSPMWTTAFTQVATETEPGHIANLPHAVPQMLMLLTYVYRTTQAWHELAGSYFFPGQAC